MSEFFIGIDVGSTTVKAVVVEPNTRRILWKAYRRHETRQPETVLRFLAAIEEAFPGCTPEDIAVFMTGSGAGPLCDPVGARFVQEVNAVTLAVESLHPDAESAIELGGQDAKIIIFQDSDTKGQRRVITSMNDKCASGTGATIDKCLIKVGLAPQELASITFDEARLHPIAAKCGVFAETDVVNLVKAGIPAREILNSLADAIVRQNLSVLTRGNTLRAEVLLLGGPNTFLPILQQCWRKRIPETWAERGYIHDRSRSTEQLIRVPQDAEYFPAYGAVVFGLLYGAAAGIPRYRGLHPLKEYCTTGRAMRLAGAGPPLSRSLDEVESFVRQYRAPPFEPPRFHAGQVVKAVIGLDGGSTSTKAVLVSEDGAVLGKAYRLSDGNPIQDTRQILAALKATVEERGAVLQVIGFGATGYAAPILDQCLKADVNIVETIAHMITARTYFPDAEVVCDIGGQDIKVLFLEQADIKDFRLSNQCSAGNGMLLQAMADQFGVPISDYAELAFRATLAPRFSYGCAVFLDSDRVNFQKEGYRKEELLAGLAMVLPKNIWQYVVGVPRLAELGTRFVLQGGTQKNLAAVKAQVDYIRERVPGARVYVHPHCGEAGALGAAMETLRVVRARGRSTFIGIEAAIGLEYETRNDETTCCNFCPNRCSRTFIDTRLPDGGTARYIAGFSCEKGTVENKQALKRLAARRKTLRNQYPNLVEQEATRAFKHFFSPEPMPEAGTPTRDVEVRRGWFGRAKRRVVTRRFQRSSAVAARRREKVRIGIPRVLSLYSVGPLFRGYFESFGMPKDHLVWSDPTSEEMFAEGGKYGAVDPCYPSKCVQAHIHNLLFHKHLERRTGPLDYIFFPCLTHVPNFVSCTVDATSCPIVAGTPKVIRAAFTKEVDFFRRAGVEYVDVALNLAERELHNDQLWRAWHTRLGITRDEHDHALAQGWQALFAFERELQQRGRAVLDEVEREGRVAVLVLGRPYHADPGLHHGIPEELQGLGYPVLSIRSIPRDPSWLARFFRTDLESGRIVDVFDISDVWPENYSTNSAQKVWAAKFAARHPNLAVLDISSFKCGHDAPTYGIIDAILKAGGTPRLIMHDLDANKAVGGISIRIRTFAYTLARRTEVLGRHRTVCSESAVRRHADAEMPREVGKPHATAAAETAQPLEHLAS